MKNEQTNNKKNNPNKNKKKCTGFTKIKIIVKNNLILIIKNFNRTI